MELYSTKRVHSQWLEKAYLNLRAASTMIKDNRLLDLACYHSHQAAEKALKAYLILNGKGLLRIHDVEYLIMVCMRVDRVFQKLIQDGIYLNPFYIEMNYPILGSVKITKSIPKRAIRAAERITGFVEQRLVGTH